MSTRKRVFVLLLVIIQACLIWPVYPLFSNIHPMLLGLPFSFFWVILMLVASFLLVLWYYLTDTHDQKSANPDKA